MIMVKMGFGRRIMQFIMNCVLSVSFSVKVNGVVSRSFRPKRGIRQSDLLSPYLFILCVEGLLALLKEGLERGCFKGVFVARNGPKASHLFFAYDCLKFVETDVIRVRI